MIKKSQLIISSFIIKVRKNLSILNIFQKIIIFKILGLIITNKKYDLDKNWNNQIIIIKFNYCKYIYI